MYPACYGLVLHHAPATIAPPEWPRLVFASRATALGDILTPSTLHKRECLRNGSGSYKKSCESPAGRDQLELLCLRLRVGLDRLAPPAIRLERSRSQVT